MIHFITNFILISECHICFFKNLQSISVSLPLINFSFTHNEIRVSFFSDKTTEAEKETDYLLILVSVCDFLKNLALQSPLRIYIYK